MLHNICVETVLHDVLTDAVSLPRIPVGRKYRDSNAGSSSPTMLTGTFWVSPSEQTALEINMLHLRPQPIAPDLHDYCSFVTNRPCGLDQGSPVSSEKKKKESRVMGSYLKFHWPLSTPRPPACSLSYSWEEEERCTEVLQDVPLMNQGQKK